MRAGERETSNAVVERSSIPTDGGVARGAVPYCERGAGSRMHGIVGLLPGCQMAA